MSVLHSDLTGAELHEPKGVDAATADQLYLSDGAASGAWTDVIDVLSASVYEKDTWTPALTFQTAGDLSIAYSSQSGVYIRIGDLVAATFNITTSTFTHTTASGQARITDLPFTVTDANNFRGAMDWQGITKANYTNIVISPSLNNTFALLRASGSGQSIANVEATDMPTAGSVILRGTIIYQTTV